MATKAKTRKAKKTIKKAAKTAEPAKAAKAKATSKAVKAKQQPSQRDARLPLPGTKLTKRTRDGRTVECTVVEDGIQYRGQIFKTLSAAGRAAAANLGVFSQAINGYLFWGLIK